MITKKDIFPVILAFTLLLLSGCLENSMESTESQEPEAKSETLVFESYTSNAWEWDGGYTYTFPYYDTSVIEGDVPEDFFEVGTLVLKINSSFDLWQGVENEKIVRVTLKNDPLLESNMLSPEGELTPETEHFVYAQTLFHEITGTEWVDDATPFTDSEENEIVIEATVEESSNSEYGYFYRLGNIEILSEGVDAGYFDKGFLILTSSSKYDLWNGEASGEKVRITVEKEGTPESETELFTPGSGAPASHHLMSLNTYYYPVLEATFVDPAELEAEIQAIIQAFDGKTKVETTSVTLNDIFDKNPLYQGIKMEYPASLGESNGNTTVYKDWDVASGSMSPTSHVDMSWNFTWIEGAPVFVFSIPWSEELHVYVFKNGVVTELAADAEGEYSPFETLAGGAMSYFYAPLQGEEPTMNDHYGAIDIVLQAEQKENESTQLYQSLDDFKDRYIITTTNDGSGCGYEKIWTKEEQIVGTLEYYFTEDCDGDKKSGFYLNGEWQMPPLENSENKPLIPSNGYGGKRLFSPDFKQFAFAIQDANYEAEINYSEANDRRIVVLWNIESSTLSLYKVTGIDSMDHDFIAWEKSTDGNYTLKTTVLLEYGTATLQPVIPSTSPSTQ